MFPQDQPGGAAQCSRQRKRHSTDWCAGSSRHRHRAATPGRAAGGGLLALLLFCSTSPTIVYASCCPVYCCCPTQRQLRHRPIRPFRGSVGSSRNRSQGFMEFIGLKEVYGVFREGLWGRRQRANCWVVAGEQTRPHTSATPLLVGGQCGQIVEVWYIGHCHPRSRTILTFHTHKLHSGS